MVRWNFIVLIYHFKYLNNDGGVKEEILFVCIDKI